MCVCVCVLTWEQPSLPNSCISVPQCDTLGRTNTGGRLTHTCKKNSLTHTVISLHIPSSEQLPDSLFLVLLLHRDGGEIVTQ